MTKDFYDPKKRSPISEKFILIGKYVRRSRVLKVILMVITLNIILAGLYSQIEGIPFYLALYWATDTVTNTGSGLVGPTTQFSWLLTTLLMWFGLGITLIFVQNVYVRMMKKMSSQKQINFKSHTLLIGWNPKIRHFLENLPGKLGVDHNYVLISNQEDRPFDLPDVVEYVRGNPDEERVLLAAGVQHASQALIVTEDDADAILVAMTIQGINIDVKIAVNLQSRENIKHLKRIGVEKIVCDEKLTGDALIQAFYDNQEDTFL